VQVYTIGCIWQRRKSENPTVSLKEDGKLNEHDFNKLPYQICRGLDYGLSENCISLMKFDGDENYFKEELYKPNERNERKFADEFII
jgi:hypothetical protein